MAKETISARNARIAAEFAAAYVQPAIPADPLDIARAELRRVTELVRADPRYHPCVEGSFRRVALAVVGHDTSELLAAVDGLVWSRSGSCVVSHYRPDAVPDVVARLAALGPDPSLAWCASDEEILARICS